MNIPNSTSLEKAHTLAQLGIWEWEVGTGLVTLSGEALRLLDFSPVTSPLSLTAFLEKISPEDHATLQERISLAIRDGVAFESEIRVLRSQAEMAYFLVKAQPIEEKGIVVRLTGILLNIDTYKKRELAIQQSKELAEDLTRAKSEFLSSMSHEIRTPLNAIIGLTDMLLQEELKPTILDNIRMIKYSSDNLLVLINDILDFSKVEAGKISFEQTEFDLPKLIHDLSKSVAFKAEEKGLLLYYYLAPDVPNIVIGDPYRLNQILLNLAANAIKFTQKGQIILRISLVRREEPSAILSFAVEDSGIGIPDGELETIFERFVQTSLTSVSQYGGSGLGLTITKKLVEFQGGQIRVESIVGQGSVFSVELPFRVSEKVALAQPVSVPLADRNLSGARLLMVEDNGMNQLVAKRLLSRWKAEIDIANNGEEALEMLRKNEYDMVLMDLHLPGMDGYQITEHIRSGISQVLSPQIPIIALTADAFPETKEKTRLAGMDDLVIKPFEQELFFQALVRNMPAQSQFPNQKP